MHIADIDYIKFYKDTCPKVVNIDKFINCIENIPTSKCKPKIIIHQVARMVYLSDYINEKIARGLPALQILFYLIIAELIAKIVFKCRNEGQSKHYVKLFFLEICSNKHQVALSKAFEKDFQKYLTVEEAINLLYDVRCDVVHEGKYYDFDLKSDNDDTPTTTNYDNITAHITTTQLRQIILEGAILGALKILPSDSSCQNILKTDFKLQ